MAEKPEYTMSRPFTTEQLATAHGVLVRELALLRNRALARQVDPADINQVFRHRAARLSGELACTQAGSKREGGALVPSQLAPPGSARRVPRWADFGLVECEYSVWW
ncbi:MAG TPA: hypothetical protein VGL06_23485 [Pseudonocardiaceae bacterium]|jgi:hypothetical protein